MTDKVYNVVMPSILAWPPGNIILTTVFLEEDAQKYIDEYPNPMLRPFMTIEIRNVTIIDTD